MGAAPDLGRGKSLVWLGEQFVARQGVDQQAGATRCWAVLVDDVLKKGVPWASQVFCPRLAARCRAEAPFSPHARAQTGTGPVRSVRVATVRGVARAAGTRGAGWRSWEATWRGDRRAKRCPRAEDSSRGFSSWAGGRAASLEYVEEAYVEFKAVEVQQQALLPGELFEMGAERAGRAALPSVGCQGIGQEELFVGRRRSPRAAVSFVRGSSLLTAPSHAWSAR